MRMTRKLVTLLTFGLFVMVLYLSATTHAAVVVTLHQPIRPQSCALIKIVGYDGKVRYRVPAGCGKLILPGTSISGNASGSFGGSSPSLPAQSSQLPVTAFYGDRTIYLESAQGKQPADGYMLWAKLFGRYTFYLQGDDRQSPPRRSMQIVGIGSKVAIVQFWPGGQRVVLELGKRTEVKLDYGSSAHIFLRLQRIQSDGTVLLHVSFPMEPNTIGTVDEGRYAFYASLACVSVLTLWVYDNLHRRYLKRHHLPPVSWWITHSHDPFSVTYDVGLSRHVPQKPPRW